MIIFLQVYEDVSGDLQSSPFVAYKVLPKNAEVRYNLFAADKKVAGTLKISYTFFRYFPDSDSPISRLNAFP